MYAFFLVRSSQSGKQPRWAEMIPRLQEQVMAPLTEAEGNVVSEVKRRAEVRNEIRDA